MQTLLSSHSQCYPLHRSSLNLLTDGTYRARIPIHQHLHILLEMVDGR